MKYGKALITRHIQWTSKFIGEIKTRNIKEYLIDISPEKQSEVDAKSQEVKNNSQAEENITGNVSEKKTSKGIRLKRELNALAGRALLRKADEEMIFDKKMHSSNRHIFGIDIVSTK